MAGVSIAKIERQLEHRVAALLGCPREKALEITDENFLLWGPSSARTPFRHASVTGARCGRSRVCRFATEESSPLTRRRAGWVTAMTVMG
jgi:hypothetical protein